MAIEFDFPSSELSKNMTSMWPKFKALMLMYANTKAPQLEAYMKLHRPWTDRTGMAKATLNARVSQPKETVVRITLAHGVDYGIWLELAHNKNYAIIGPTINTQGPVVESELANIMSKLSL